MKKQFLFLALVAISFFACTKTEEEVIAEAIEIMPSTIGATWEIRDRFFKRDGSVSYDDTGRITIAGTIKHNGVQYGIIDNSAMPNENTDSLYFTYSNSRVFFYEKLGAAPNMGLFIPKTNGEYLMTTDSIVEYDSYTQQTYSYLSHIVGYTTTTVVNGISCYKNIQYSMTNGDTVERSILYFKPGLGFVADSTFTKPRRWENTNDKNFYLESVTSFKRIK